MWVYIMANPWSRVLYVGMTNGVNRRVWEHKHGIIEGFTRKYNVTSLVYFEEHDGPRAAIERERQIKGWVRWKKLALIESMNPGFADLAEGWYEAGKAPNLRLRRLPQNDGTATIPHVSVMRSSSMCTASPNRAGSLPWTGWNWADAYEANAEFVGSSRESCRDSVDMVCG